LLPAADHEFVMTIVFDFYPNTVHIFLTSFG
jgi:hypothetical protein